MSIFLKIFLGLTALFFTLFAIWTLDQDGSAGLAFFAAHSQLFVAQTVWFFGLVIMPIHAIIKKSFYEIVVVLATLGLMLVPSVYAMLALSGA